jgi:hypothetical protein
MTPSSPLIAMAQTLQPSLSQAVVLIRSSSSPASEILPRERATPRIAQPSQSLLEVPGPLPRTAWWYSGHELKPDLPSAPANSESKIEGIPPRSRAPGEGGSR